MPETPDPPVTPTFPVKRLWKLPVFIVLAAVIGISIMGSMFFLRDTNPPPPLSTPTSTATLSNNMTTFTGKSLGISFEYPVAWGTAKEEIIPIGDKDNYHGNNYKLSFSHNPYLTIVGASKDSSSPGVGGSCPIRQFFKGTAETGITACNQCNKENEGCGGCKETTIGSQTSVSYLYKPTTYCGTVGFQKIVYLKTPYIAANNDFPGLVFTLSITTPVNGQLADLGYRSGSSSPGDGSEQEQQRKYLTGIFNDTVQQYESSLLSTNPSDYLASMQLSQLDKLLESLRFTQ